MDKISVYQNEIFSRKRERMNKVLQVENLTDAMRELEKIEVSSRGVVVMAPKMFGVGIKLTNLKVGAANILKQEMLSIGGDAAVARGAVNGTKEISDVILLCNIDKLQKLTKKLGSQTIFGLPEIRKYLTEIVDDFLHPKFHKLNFNDNEIELQPTKIMGILNVTPDSFSDGNKFIDAEIAVQHAEKMIENGADFIDIGGESTRPNAIKVDAKTELKLVIPIIEKLPKTVPISIDTTKAIVARKAIEAGASIVNDISALRFDAQMVEVLQDFPKVSVVLMHMLGNPQNMQKNPVYTDVIDEILDFFAERIEFCEKNGILRDRIILDPGIGFGKRQTDNLQILKKIAEFKTLNLPVILGASRKSFIGEIDGSNCTERLVGSLATTALAFQNNIEIVRVHDVLEHKKMLKTLMKIRKN